MYDVFREAQKNHINKINRRKLLEDYIDKMEEFQSAENPSGKAKTEFELLEIERKMSKLKEYSTFFINGRANFEEVKKYYKLVYGTPERVEENKSLEEIIVVFSKIDSTVSREEERERLKRETLKDKTDEEYKVYEQKYKDVIQKYSERFAIEELYSAYLNGRTLDRMQETERVRYIDSIGYLYMSQNPKMNQLAQTFIKYNFPGIKVDENGNVTEQTFRELYESYHDERKRDAFESITKNYHNRIKKAIDTSGKCNIAKTDFEIDIDLLNDSMKDVRKELLDDEKLYTSDEMKIISKIRDNVNLEDEKDIETLVAIAASATKAVKEYKRGNEEEKQRLEEQKVLSRTINKFMRSPQNRAYFAKYMDANGIKKNTFPDEINQGIIDALEYKGEIITAKKEDNEKESLDEESRYSRELENSTMVLECILTYDGNIDAVKEKLKKFGVDNSKFCNLFKKDSKQENELDEERIKEIVNTIKSLAKLRSTRQQYCNSMAMVLVEMIDEYSSNFESFSQLSEVTIRDISEKNQDIMSVERDLSEELELYQKSKEEGNDNPKKQEPVSEFEIGSIMSLSSQKINVATILQEDEVAYGVEQAQGKRATVVMAEGSTTSETRMISDSELNNLNFVEIVARKPRDLESDIKGTIDVDLEGLQSQIDNRLGERDNSNTENIAEMEIPEESKSEKKTWVDVLKSTAIAIYTNAKNMLSGVKLLKPANISDVEKKENQKDVNLPNAMDKYVVDQSNVQATVILANSSKNENGRKGEDTQKHEEDEVEVG